MMTKKNIGRFTQLSAEKLRGGYYTSPQIAQWLSKWAINRRSDSILEPSCGDGVFLEAAYKRLSKLGATTQSIVKSLVGIEVVSSEAELARARLLPYLGPTAKRVVEKKDFFTWWQATSRPSFDAVVGNPPFIRYQTFPEPHRSRAMEIMVDIGLTPNRLTNIWVPFVVASVSSLRPGGKLALVLPAELLQVSYASQLRSFLADRFRQISIVTCNELFFENAEQEVVLLLAEGALSKASKQNACSVRLIATNKVTEIIKKSPKALIASASPKTLRHDNEKWLKYFLTQAEIEFMRKLRESVAAPLSHHASIDVGVVTGKNDFFVLSKDRLDKLGLYNYTVPLVSRSSHLHGARIDKPEWSRLAKAGEKVYLLHHDSLKKAKVPNRIVDYIRFGEANAFHKGYKCSIRSPWYVVPSVWIPDGFLFRQIYNFPRAVMNQAGATSTDTIHRLTCKTNPNVTIANTYTYLTAASSEIEGRSYGGGVLELEPTEAEKLLMPSKLGQAVSLDECDRLIRAGRLDSVLEENSRQVLREAMGLSRGDCNRLRDIWIKLRDRRMSRKRHSKVHKEEISSK